MENQSERIREYKDGLAIYNKGLSLYKKEYEEGRKAFAKNVPVELNPYRFIFSSPSMTEEDKKEREYNFWWEMGWGESHREYILEWEKTHTEGKYWVKFAKIWRIGWYTNGTWWIFAPGTYASTLCHASGNIDQIGEKIVCPHGV